MTLQSDLIAARALIDTPQKWAKHSFGRANEPMCALGACEVAGNAHWRDLETSRALRLALPEGDWTQFGDNLVAAFNDDPRTTHADILALFDRAIKAAS